MKFLFFGLPPGAYKTPPNVECVGQVEGDIYKRMTCLLRLCQHDGCPVGGIEAKQRRLHVIENYPSPGFLPAMTIDQVVSYLKQDWVHQPDRTHWPAWYRTECGAEAFKKKIEAPCVS